MDAGAAVEVVRILRDEEPEPAKQLELEERQVGRVGRYLTRRNPTFWCRQTGVAPRPHPLRAAKIGDARVGADTSAREGDHVLGPGDPPGDLPDVPLEGLFVGHGLRRIVARLLLPAAFDFGTLHLPQAGGFHPVLLDQFPHWAAVDLRPLAPRPTRGQP